jgi:phosphoglucomutase
LALAKTQGADLVLATDPDADRMGVAVPGADGQWRCLTGNTISCLLAQYTLERLKASGALPPQGHPRARIITTFVTTPLLQRIAQAHGVPCVKTLTGFKWIAGKMRAYEQQLAQYQQQQGLPCLYDALPLAQRRQALLQNATCFLYGTEESYGYLVSDRVRDKDAHGAMLLFCELVASLKEQGRSVEDYLQQLYLQHGYFLEDQINLYYEGVQGAARIKAILDSYRVSPPVSVGGVAVTDFQSLEQDLPLDADGQRPLHQALFLVTLASGAHYAVRGSGTEPKLKLYLFVHTAVDDAALPQAMARAQSQMTELKAAVMHETQARAPAGGG